MRNPFRRAVQSEPVGTYHGYGPRGLDGVVANINWLPVTAQERLRAEAAKLDRLAGGLTVRVIPDEPHGVTAADMRLMADLLDYPTFGVEVSE